jgi:hypothetical protein
LRRLELLDASDALGLATARLHPRHLELLDSEVVGTAESGIGQLALVPAMARVEHLRMACFRDGAIEALVASPLAPRLRVLDAGITLSARAWAALVDDPRLAGLEELSIHGAMAGRTVPLVGKDLDYRPLFAAKRLDALRVLRLTSAHVTLDVVEQLFASPLARRLEVIDLRNNPWLKGRSAASLRKSFDGVLDCDPTT